MGGGSVYAGMSVPVSMLFPGSIYSGRSGSLCSGISGSLYSGTGGSVWSGLITSLDFNLYSDSRLSISCGNKISFMTSSFSFLLKKSEKLLEINLRFPLPTSNTHNLLSESFNSRSPAFVRDKIDISPTSQRHSLRILCESRFSIFFK